MHSAVAGRRPTWILFPLGLALARASIYRGDLRWPSVAVALLLDIGVLYLLLELATRWPLGRSRPVRHVVPFLAAVSVYAPASLALQRAIASRDSSRPAVGDSLLHATLFELGIFLIWAGLAHAIVYLRRYRAEESKALRLRLDLADAARRRAEAEIRSFESEMNPTFLIGALRAAASDADADPARTERLIAEIGDAVRHNRPMMREVTLVDELDALTPFVALESARLNQQIELDVDVPDALLDARFPHLVLAALVREALRGSSATGTIGIGVTAAALQEDHGSRMEIVVASRFERADGSQAPADEVIGRTTDHLREAFDGAVSIDVAPSTTGSRIRLCVPIEDGARSERAPGVRAVSISSSRRRVDRAMQLQLAAWFVALSALNLRTTLTKVRSNGAIVPAHLAIPEALLAAACFTFVLYVAIRLTRRPFSPGVFGLHAVAAVALGLLNSMYKWAWVSAIGYPYPPHTFGGILGRTISGAMMYVILAGILGAFEYARRHRSAEEKSLRLRTELAEAERKRVESELRALKAELNPHFLGNALNGAASLTRTDPAAARAVLTQLADVVTAVVARVGTQEVTLQEEIDGLAPFIAVEQSRFGDRLAVHWEVDDDARAARVPHLILQPLVENAVKHGLGHRGGHIVVAGRRAGERLQLSVRDDGVGPEQAQRATDVRRSGIGLANSRARLEQLYGAEASLHLAAAPGAGTIVTVTLPWH